MVVFFFTFSYFKIDANEPYFCLFVTEYVCLKDAKLVERHPIELCSVKTIEWTSPRYCFELYCSNNVRKLYRSFEEDDLNEWISTLKTFNELLLKRSSVNKELESPYSHSPKNGLYAEKDLLSIIQNVDPENKRECGSLE